MLNFLGFVLEKYTYLYIEAKLQNDRIHDLVPEFEGVWAL